MIDLKTHYMGLTLKNPLVASSSPLTESVENLVRLEDAGIAAVVLPSLFEEQLTLESVTLDEDLWRGAQEFAEAVTYLPDLDNYNTNPDGYLELVRQAKRRLSVPVFASLNGSTPGGWIRYAREIEQAGADGLELNIYAIETDVHRSAEAVEDSYCDLVHKLKASVKLPIAVKMTPFFSSLPHIAKRFDRAGADALILFNRFYQPDFDIQNLEVIPRLTLSEPNELLLRLHWAAILFSRVRPDLAITGGVHSAEDVLKALMAGASVAMMASVLLKNGSRYVHRVLDDLTRWMSENEYDAIRQMQGSMSHRSVPNPAAFERGNYMKVLSSYALRLRQ
ncbi:MAG TPA: dihydroorotate dehydrogenase-like protein [Candidatus Acidoferrum sp.]|nr:dihydroorotate dehydrogenase-like protein [Candidatus Acidoferrum sp.]